MARRSFGIVGSSVEARLGLCLALLPALNRRGLRVSVMLATAADFDLDKPGKDSYEHRAAGAREVMISSQKRWTLLHENEGEGNAAAVMEKMAPVDLLLLEGTAAGGRDSIALCEQAGVLPDQGRIVAQVGSPVDAGLPVFAPEDADGIANFIMTHCALRGTPAGAC